jgi:molybdopterin synthase catalytic subunit
MRSHRVLLFAGLREILGSSIDVSLPIGATVTELLAVLGEKHAAVRAGRVAVAVNLEVVPPNRALAEGDEIALLPPVGGG